MALSYSEICVKFKSLISTSYQANDTTSIEKEWLALKTNDGDKRNILDGVLKDFVLDIYSSQAAIGELVTFTIHLCRLDLCSTSTPIVLLSDVFDICTISECENLFSYVEKNVSVWKDDLFFSACKNNLLRMCNDLLRRLSRSQNTVFRGRILLFLASFFPFSERSGLNLVSEFNLDNANEYKKEDVADETMEVDDAAEGSTLRVDYNLYNKFLTLQDYLRNPAQCYTKLRWAPFALSWTDTFQTFQNMKLEKMTQKRKSAREHLIDAEEGSVFFAKYLTNPRLLQLQLSDASFRRSLIIQGLITLQYLSSNVKSKLDTFELRQVQQDWVRDQETFLYSLLAETPKGSERFRDITKHILSREQLWNNWKNDSCPEFKPPGSMEEDDKPRTNLKRKNLGDIMKNTKNKFYLGNPEMNRLWNLNADNLEACKSQERSFIPSIDQYMAEAISQMDPTAGIEPQYKKVNDPNFAWRALRLLSQRSTCFFSHAVSTRTINKIPDSLETCLKSLIKDQPSAADENEIKVDNEEEKEEKEVVITKRKEVKMTDEAIEGVALRLGEEWLRLGAKLGYTDAADPAEMLRRWAAEDEDATPDNLAYTLEGLKFDEAAKYLKKEFCAQQDMPE